MDQKRGIGLLGTGRLSRLVYGIKNKAGFYRAGKLPLCPTRGPPLFFFPLGPKLPPALYCGFLDEVDPMGFIPVGTGLFAQGNTNGKNNKSPRNGSSGPVPASCTARVAGSWRVCGKKRARFCAKDWFSSRTRRFTKKRCENGEKKYRGFKAGLDWLTFH